MPHFISCLFYQPHVTLSSDGPGHSNFYFGHAGLAKPLASAYLTHHFTLRHAITMLYHMLSSAAQPTRLATAVSRAGKRAYDDAAPH